MATTPRPAWRTSSFTDNGGTCVEVAPVWRTSTFSENGATCVEVAPEWRTSTFTDNGASCVEVAPECGAVRVRDTKDRGHGPELVLHPDLFTALCTAATTRTAGPLVEHAERVTVHAARPVPTHWHVTHEDVTLHYTDAEWRAFAAGVRAGEFAFTVTC